MGVGHQSSQFTEKLIDAIGNGPRSRELIAVAIYDRTAGPEIRRRWHRKIRRLRVLDISVPPTSDPQVRDRVLSDLSTLRERATKFKPETILLVVDAEILNNREYAAVFHHLRVPLVQGKISALCFTNDPMRDASALDLLQAYTGDDALETGKPIFEAAFVVRSTRSPLSDAVGGQDPQNSLLATSMAGLWGAHLYHNYNPTFSEQVKLVRLTGLHFIGLAIGSTGLTMERKPGFFGSLQFALHGRSLRRITTELAQNRIATLANDLLQNQPYPRTTVQPFDPRTVRNLPVSINVIAPFKKTDSRFNPVRDGVDHILRGLGYQVTRTSMITGRGTAITGKPRQPATASPVTTGTAYAANNAPMAYPPAYPPHSAPPPLSNYPSTDAPTTPLRYPASGAPAMPGAAPAVASVAPMTPMGNTATDAARNRNAGGTSASAAATAGAGPTKDAFICQVCVLFGIERNQI
jgi:hypothetical protein